MNEPIHHDQHYPVTASAGGDNAYYLKGCSTVQRSPSYASCLFKISEVEAGRVNDYNRECSVAINGKTCEALGMRDQEQLQGVAMFYFPRAKNIYLPVAVAGDFGVPITNLTDKALIPAEPKRGFVPKAAKPSSSILDAIDGENDYAKAINASLAESSAGKANAGPMPGDFPIDRKIKAMPLPTFPQGTPAPVLRTHSRPPINPGETPLQYARRINGLTA